MTSVRRLFVLLCGYEILPKTISTRDRGARFIMSEPISVYLLDTDSGWILLDTGFDPAHIQDAASRENNFFKIGMYPPWVLPEHKLDWQLNHIGLSFADISHVILSHLHFDHTGYLKYFPHAKVSIQRKEYEFGFGGKTTPGHFLKDFSLPSIAWNIVDGDWEVVPGIKMVDTRGHTAGHQSAIIQLPKTGTVVLPFDAGDLQENFDQEILPGDSVDDDAAMVAIRRLKSIVAETNARMILFHDPVAIQGTRLAPESYD
jgi:N-acyl homoserine lactone hydrolase